MASGIAFDLLLAFVPFALLVISAVAYLLPLTPAAATRDLMDLIGRLVPAATSDAARALIKDVVRDILRTRKELGLAGAAAFVWFSARLFSSLRLVMARVFEEPEPRPFLHGVLFDLRLTLYAAGLAAAYVITSTFLATASAAWARVFGALGVPLDGMTTLKYVAGRVIAFVLVTAIFHGLYSHIPRRHVPRRSALIAALTAGVGFEVAKWLFGASIHRMAAASFYTGTLAAVVIVMFWVYYAALVFIVGGEVLEAVEMERLARR